MAGREFRELDPAEVKQLLDEGKAELIDVREKQEWDQARIAGAVLMPLSRFDPNDVQADPEKTGIYMCHSGMRTWNAQMFFKMTGYRDVAHLKGGLMAWIGAGLPIQEGPEEG